MGEMQDLTGFQRDLMFVIARLDEPKGLDVKEVVEQYYGTEVRHGRLYPNLDTLVENGLVDKGQHDRRTNKYVLTGEGEQAIRDRVDWQRECLPEDMIGNVEIEPA